MDALQPGMDGANQRCHSGARKPRRIVDGRCHLARRGEMGGLAAERHALEEDPAGGAAGATGVKPALLVEVSVERLDKGDCCIIQSTFRPLAKVKCSHLFGQIGSVSKVYQFQVLCCFQLIMPAGYASSGVCRSSAECRRFVL